MGGESVRGRGVTGPKKMVHRHRLNDAQRPTMVLSARVGKIFNGDSRRDNCVGYSSIIKPAHEACQSLFERHLPNAAIGHISLTEGRIFDRIAGLCVINKLPPECSTRTPSPN